MGYHARGHPLSSESINHYLQHTLREDFTSPNPEVRKGAIYALGRLGSGPDVLTILRNVAAEDDDPEVRYTAKKALNYWEGVLTDQTSTRVRVEVTDAGGGLDLARLEKALGSANAGEQIAGVIEAVKLGDPACLAPIAGLLDHEQDPWVLSMAIKATGSLGGPEAAERLAPFLDHDNHRVVANTIEALEMLPDPDIATRLARFLDSDDNRVRANAVKALHPHLPDQAIATLRQMAVNHRPWMRASAIYCLKVLDDDRCRQILYEMTSKEYADELMRELLDAVVAQGDADAVGLLGWMAEGEGERAHKAETACKVLADKLGLTLNQVADRVTRHREQVAATQGQASGMFTVGDLDDDEDEGAPRGPAEPMKASPVSGYGVHSEAARPPIEDPGSKVFLAVAVGLALFAGVYGGYRLMFDPPKIPEATRPTGPTGDGVR